ncbi:EAL domain-containing protein [Streptomyces sp. NP160]|uniref:putative bifunctional diguanylate cyclase/phosphodiesterase n=1 Tax=Streptomyces sp. NP160 TaxID=2586637 RepID=UPI0011190E6E|nr:bifunctional diguanylate cyclase/phosphodiesterase [Streptomyces sp. NP160]TNM63230.1 EAL domain-containing protein [Streptomyces sp. NP160]
MTTATAATALSLVVALLAGASAVGSSRSRSGAQRRFWVLLGPAAAVWTTALALATVAQASGSAEGRSATDLGLASLVSFVAWPVLAVAAVAALTVRHQARTTLPRDVLDCVLLTLTGASALWSFVLAPAWGRGTVPPETWVVVITLMALATQVPQTALHAHLRSPERGGGLHLALLGLAVVAAGDVASARGYLLTGRSADPTSLALWSAGWSVVLAGALLHRRRPQLPVTRPGLVRGPALPLSAAAIAVLATALAVVRDDGSTGPVAFWLSTGVLVALTSRTLVELRRTTLLQRRLERKVQERTRALADSRHRFASLVAHSTHLVVVVDRDLRLTYTNPGATRLLGGEQAPPVGRPAADHLHDGEGPATAAAALRSVVEGRVEQLEVRLALRHADGHRVDVDAVVTNLLDDPDVQGLVVNGRDVTEALALERRLSEQAFTDALTGLPNRALFRDRLEQALRSRAARGPVKVMYLDLDGFKRVNDTLGHDAGDELLVAVAERLRNVLREGDTVARLGGDEFAVLLDEGVVLDEATDLAQRLCDAVSRPFSVRGTEVRVGTSTGLASSRIAGRSAEDLMKAADLAMYEAKAAGRGRFAVYHPVMQRQLAERVQLEADLRSAVEHGSFAVVYQPLVDMGSGAVSGVEALVRWLHPERGVVVPADFIPLAESTGLIDAIGSFVLHEACLQVATWRAEVPGAETMRLSVNLSAHQLRDPELVASVVHALASSRLPASCLVLEVTESVFVGQDDAALQALDALRELGVRLAIDDFGTGYSSLSYLHRLPIDIIKIDKSFVDRLSSDGDTSLVDAILSMAGTLGMSTVAEGVEHEHQRATLAAQGCATGQGFHFSPPVEADVLPELLLRALAAAAEGGGAAGSGGTASEAPAASATA